MQDLMTVGALINTLSQFPADEHVEINYYPEEEDKSAAVVLKVGGNIVAVGTQQ